MVGILLIVGPRIPAHHRVDLQKTNQKDEPALQLVLRNIAHAVVGVVEIEDLFQTKRPSNLGVVALVPQDVVADAAGRAKAGGVAHVVVGGAH
jgi:hypothetical protein